MQQQDVEIQVKKIYCVSMAATRLPFLIEDASRSEAEIATVKDDALKITVGADLRLDVRVLDLRVPAHCAIFRIQSAFANLFREYFSREKFVEIHSPKMISAASEGGANVFKLQYFNRFAYLAQSPQLYKQMAVMGDFMKVFEVGPVFRAENSNTHRHLTEFTGLDIEMTLREHYFELLDVLDDMFEFIVNGVNTRYAKELEIVRRQYPSEPLVYKKPALRLTYPEAVALLRENHIEMGDLEDLSTVNEKALGRIVKEKYGTDFYMIHRYPSGVRPFYTMPCPDNPLYTNSFDLFVRGEEICSGSQRIHDSELLLARAASMKVDLTPIQSYVDCFKYGAWPHGGAGIGLERIVMLFLGLDNIRKTSLFPRDPSRVTP